MGITGVDNIDGRTVLVDTLAAAAAIGRPPGTLRRWAHEGRLTRLGSDAQGRALYDLAAVYRVAGEVRMGRPSKENRRPSILTGR